MRFTRLGATMLGTVLCFAAAADGEVVNLIITMDGSQEVPAVTTPATGAGTATLDTDTNLFSWNISFTGLSSAETAAHFHGPAPECVNTGVQIGLPLGSPIVGSATVTPAQASDILLGLWYVNVHTVTNPGGEIRGQVRPTALGDPLPDPIAAGSVHVQLVPVATGLTAPNWGTSAPGDDARIFVTDQNGILWAIDTATGDKTVFLDNSADLVSLGVFGPGSFDERGLLGVAYHPEYRSNGLLYTYSSEPETGPADFVVMPAGESPNHHAVVREWHVPNPADPASVVDPGSTRVLLRIEQPQFNHNAGAVNFGPDGMLYIALGDGGGADDKDGQNFIGGQIIGHGCSGNGQDGSTVLGSILRIDPGGNDSANGQYGIPADNPFVGEPELDEIYARGFRNPFRFSFDRGTGDLYAADVGQNDIEEIDLVVAGGNYGWRHKEGSFFFVPNGNSSGYVTDRPQSGPPGVIDPIAEYDHDEGIAIVGGFVYRGTKIPALIGKYVFGEFAVSFNNDGRLFYLADGNEINEFQLVGQAGLGLSLLGFGQDAQGELYVLANTSGVPFGTDGLVLRIATKTGDLNADGIVGMRDLKELLGSWGPCDRCPADINDDGDVNILDLLAQLANWG